MNPEIVIALYRPNEGREEELRALIDEHLPVLRRLELVTQTLGIQPPASESRAVNRHRPDIARESVRAR